MDQQQQPQTQPETQNTKLISATIVILLVFGIGYILLTKYSGLEKNNEEATTNPNQGPMVVVENTPGVDGSLPVPAGFPQDIPIEQVGISESATTNYPDQNAKQLSVSYQSSKTIAQKYTEYKTYMTNAGYSLTEGSSNAPVRSIFGTKVDANLSVAISSSGGKTLVQLSYLLK